MTPPSLRAPMVAPGPKARTGMGGERIGASGTYAVLRLKDLKKFKQVRQVVAEADTRFDGNTGNDDRPDQLEMYSNMGRPQ